MQAKLQAKKHSILYVFGYWITQNFCQSHCIQDIKLQTLRSQAGDADFSDYMEAW